MSRQHRQYCQPWAHQTYRTTRKETRADNRVWKITSMVCSKCPWEKVISKTIRKK